MDNNYNNGNIPMDQPIGQPMSQPMDQPIGQPMSQPMDQPIGMSPQQPVDQQPMEQQMYQQPTGQQMYQQPTGQQMYQQPMGQQMYQQMGMPVGMAQQQMGMAPQQPNGKKQKKQKAPKVKKPMTGGKIAAIISGCVVLVAAIVCGILFIPKLFKPAKDVVIDAFEATFSLDAKEASQDTYMQSVVGLNEIMDTYNKEGGESGISFTLNSANGIQAPYKMSLSCDAKTDMVSKLIETSLGFSVDGTGVISGNIVVDENNIYLAVPELVDGYFSLPCANTLVELQNSPLGQSMGLADAPSISFNLFGTAQSGFNSDYVNAVETLWDSVEVKKEGKEKIDVNGETVKAKLYTVTLTSDAMCDAFNSMYDAVMTDEYIEQIAAAGGMTVEEAKTTLQTVKAMIPTLIKDDLVFMVYIKDGKVVKLTSEGTTSVLGVKMGYDFFCDIDDDKMTSELVFDVMGEKATLSLYVNDRSGNPNGGLVFAAAGEEMKLDFACENNISDSAETIKFIMAASYNSKNVMNAYVDMNINKNANTFIGSILFDAMGEEIKVSFDGEFTDIKKGVGYTEKFNNISCEYNGVSMVEMSAVYKLYAGKPQINGVAGATVYDLTTLTEADFNGIIAANEQNIVAWLDNIVNNTGAFGQDLSDAIYGNNYDEPVEVPEVKEELSFDNAILVVDDKVKIHILGCIDGFKLSSATEYWVDCSTEASSYLSLYALNKDYPTEDILADSNMPSEENGDTIYAMEENQQLTLSDGTTVTYNYAQYDFFGYKVSYYVMVKDLGDAKLEMEAYIYDDEMACSKEQLAEMLNNNNLEVTVQ